MHDMSTPLPPSPLCTRELGRPTHFFKLVRHFLSFSNSELKTSHVLHYSLPEGWLTALLLLFFFFFFARELFINRHISEKHENWFWPQLT